MHSHVKPLIPGDLEKECNTPPTTPTATTPTSTTPTSATPTNSYEQKLEEQNKQLLVSGKLHADLQLLHSHFLLIPPPPPRPCSDRTRLHPLRDPRPHYSPHGGPHHCLS